MKQLTDSELLKVVIKENGILRSQLAYAQSNIDYIAMMADIDITTDSDGVSEIE